MVTSSSERDGPRRAPRGARRGPFRSPVRPRWIGFALPSIVLVGAFFILPFVLNIPFAFSSWSGYSTDIRLIGLSNFELLWDRGILQNSIGITVVYAIIAMTVQNVVSMSLAPRLRRTNRVNAVFRSAFFIPVLISPLAAGYIWRAIVSPDGPLNGVIGLVVPGFDHAWLGIRSAP